MVCLRNMCIATLHKGYNNVIIIIIIIIIIIGRKIQKIHKLIAFPTTNSLQKNLCEKIVRTSGHVGYNTQANLTLSVSGVITFLYWTPVG